ncbi:MAG: transporter [Alistipes sp.]|nr:transporter [Alistipes sp.]
MKRPSSHTMRTVAMPAGMIVGALLCRQIVALDIWSGGWLTPSLIFVMLFFTYCRVDITRMRVTMMHFWLFAAQIIGSMALYTLCLPLGQTIAQGAMICALAPIAMAAVVIGGMLGANIENMTTYSLLCNIGTAFVAPFVLSWVGNGECTLVQILSKVAPLLIAPFVAGQLCRLLTPKLAGWVADHSRVSFYIWLVSLSIIVGRTTAFVIDHSTTEAQTEIVLAIVAAVICVAQFILGRKIGAKYGDTVAGGQSLGQKNTILAVWMAQSFLNPLSSVAPTAYIIWQNIVNSYQIYKKRD